MSAEARMRVDVWLWRARFAKTRAAAARLVAEGRVRLVRGGGASRSLSKPSAEIAEGDTLLLQQRGRPCAVRVVGLGARRGPPAEARTLYETLAESAES
jgi:ribosomal 50S subunit-recycling heat shock protein